jgi:alkanesulfonate monooxygenase SsuD/methylene tetrahydromethanopterin reductase-like flavin-dependent oxidoreductase (luciferase family)
MSFQAGGMRYALSLGNGGPAADPRTMVELAALAEDSGWDAVFLEDYIVYQGKVGTPTFDPWIILAAMATATRRVLLGPMVTPLPRRRPWKLAMEAVSLDHLSGGRVVLGIGAGDTAEASFVAAGEPRERRVAAEMLDEGLEILPALLAGEEVSHQGKHYRIDGLRLTPGPPRQRRIPTWIGGDWLVRGVRRRLVRWGDGSCLYRGTPGTEGSGTVTAQDVRDLLALVERERGSADGFDVCVGGQERRPDSDQERDLVRSAAAAGATWWQEWVAPAELGPTREAIRRGPVRVG